MQKMINFYDVINEETKRYNPNPNSWSSIQNINNALDALDQEKQINYLI